MVVIEQEGFLQEINHLTFCFECLGKVGLANQSFSIHKNDGLKLINTYLTLSLKCVPSWR